MLRAFQVRGRLLEVTLHAHELQKSSSGCVVRCTRRHESDAETMRLVVRTGEYQLKVAGILRRKKHCRGFVSRRAGRKERSNEFELRMAAAGTLCKSVLPNSWHEGCRRISQPGRTWRVSCLPLSPRSLMTEISAPYAGGELDQLKLTA